MELNLQSWWGKESYIIHVHCSFLNLQFSRFWKSYFFKNFFLSWFFEWVALFLKNKCYVLVRLILFNVNSNELRIKKIWRLIWFQILHICAQLYTILYLTPKYQINKSYQIIVRNKEYSIPTLIITFLKMSFFHSLVCGSSFR